MIRELLLDRIEQGVVNDRWLLGGQDLTLISDLADIEPVAQEIEQRGLVAGEPDLGGRQYCG